jgi:hypothetical protein
VAPTEVIDPDDPILSVPPPRYNAMLAVLRNTLYMLVFSHAFVLDASHSLRGVVMGVYSKKDPRNTRSMTSIRSHWTRWIGMYV